VLKRFELHSTVAIVAKHKGKYLLVKRANKPFKGYWAVPGGHIDPGESAYEAAVREAKEEVGNGLQLEKRPAFSFVHDVYIAHRHHCLVFMAKVKDRGKIRAGSDAARLGFFTINQMRRMNLTDYTLLIINKLLENKL